MKKTILAHLEQCLKAATAAGQPFFINANITDPHRLFPGSARAEAEAAASGGNGLTETEEIAAPVKLFLASEVSVASFQNQSNLKPHSLVKRITNPLAAR